MGEQAIPIVVVNPNSLSNSVPAVRPDQPQSSPRCETPPQLTSAQLLESVARLDDLASAIHNFKARFDELTTHLDFIQRSIDARFNDPAPTPAPAPTPTPTPAAPPPEAAPPAPRSLLKSLCESGNGRALRKYIIDGLCDRVKLRAELPAALRAAPSPARLVLDCVGRFFAQGSRAFEKDTKLVQIRRASVLAMESLVSALADGGTKLDEEVRREAEEAAVVWRRRLVNEGGLASASEMDARGLLFLIAGYGVPKSFRDGDVLDLVRAGKGARWDVLRKSRVLLTTVTDILQRMMANGMRIEALDVVSALGIEDKFSPEKILASFIEACTETLKRERRQAKDSPTLLQQAIEKQLANLKSALKFIKDRQLDSMELPLKETITKLEEENFKATRKNSGPAKRRETENEDNRNLIEVTKRPRLASNSVQPMSSPNNGFHEQMAAGYANERSQHNGLIQKYGLDPGAARLTHDYTVSESAVYGSHTINGHPAEEAMIYGSRVGSLGESVLREQWATDHCSDSSYNHSALETSLRVSGAGCFPGSAPVNMPGIGSRMQSGGIGPSSAYDVPSTGSFSGAQRDVEVDRAKQIMVSNGELNGWPGSKDATHVGRLPASFNGIQMEMEVDRGKQIMVGNSDFNGWSGSRDATLVGRSPGQSIVGEPALGLFGPSPSIESFLGFPSSPPNSAAAWTAADLYRFVDAVVELEYRRSSINKDRSTTPLLATRHSSYSYL